MSKRIAINGFGRIGRNFFRCVMENHPQIEVVSINDIAEAKYIAYYLKYDSIYGRFKGKIEVKDKNLIINGHEISVTAERDPAKLPHAKNSIDVVVESTGLFTNKEDAKKHLDAGAKRVLITAPAKNPDITVVLGCNDNKITKDHKIISNASCTTNCLGPLVKVLDDNYKIINGFMTTVHSYTGNQNSVDTIQSGDHEKMTRGRACAVNIIPTSTGAAKAIGEIFPHLKGKLDGFAMRVPTINGSVVDFKANIEKNTTIEDVNDKMKKAASGELNGILSYTDDPIVSTDIVGDSHSSIFCSLFTKVISNLVSVVSWYDNEWGYSFRLADVIVKRL